MKSRAVIVFAFLCLSAGIAVAVPQTDAKGCKDHPLFTRMPDYWIHNCQEKEFDTHQFATGKGTTADVEGRLWKVSFYPQADLKTKPSELQIRRNFQNAVQKLGGKLVGSDRGHDTYQVVQNGKEFWIDLTAEFTGKYGYFIVQKGSMAQDITANAAAFSNDIRNTGHATVYILFDTGKADIKPESAQAVAEIARLLKSDPGLKLFVVGHTDDVGGVDSNLKLSDQRASSVMQALVRDHGIAAARLRAFGAGQFAPVASNDAEDGRARNRRVELVKQ